MSARKPISAPLLYAYDNITYYNVLVLLLLSLLLLNDRNGRQCILRHAADRDDGKLKKMINLQRKKKIKKLRLTDSTRSTTINSGR